MIKEVERGAQWLDKEHPGWWNKVPTVGLDMEKCGYCVLGHVITVFKWEELWFRTHGDGWGVSHGFNLGDTYDRDDLWQPLGNLWVEQIIQRREAEVADLLPVVEEILR